MQITNPLGHVVRRELDALGVSVTKEIDANGNAAIKKYDRLGELREIIEPGDDWTKRILFSAMGNPAGQYIEVQYRQGADTPYRYERSYFDGLKRVYRTEKSGWADNVGNHAIIVDTEYFGETEQIIAQSLPYVAGQSAKFKRFEYDSSGKVKKQINADGTFKTVGLNALSSAFILENGKFRITHFDARGRKKQIIEQVGADLASAATTTFQFGYLEQTTTNPDGQILRQQYDTLGRQIRVIEGGKSHAYVYDDEGNIAYSASPKGEVIRYVFDSLNRVTLKDAPGDSNDVRYQYDSTNAAHGLGRATRIEDASGSTEFHYDAKGNIAAWTKSMDGQVFAFQASYDPEKRLQKLRYPDGDEVTYVYHANGVLHQVLLNHRGSISPVVTYSGTNTAGEFVRLTGNNVQDIGTYALDTHKPLSLKTILPAAIDSAVGATIRDLTYHVDPMGNIAQIVDNRDASETKTFNYDGLNRMVNATGSYGMLSYEFSKGGNLLRKHNDTQSFNDSTNPQAVTRTKNAAYRYDENGNMVERDNLTFSYDAENKLVSANLAANDAIAFVYDFAGQRAIKRASQQVVYYLAGIKNYGALYELTQRPGFLEAHTKYIYGIQSDRVAQVTRSDVNLAALMNFNSRAVLASLDTRGLSNLVTKMAHTVNVWLIHPQLSRRIIWHAFFLGCIGIFVLFAYSALRWRNDFAQRAPFFFYSMPFALCVFFFFAGCSQKAGLANNGAAWADLPTDGEVPPLGQGARPVPGIYFYHPDHLGSASFVTNATGTVVTTLKYKPYGELDAERSSGLDLVRYKFTGQEEDSETGFYNYNARLYNPDSGTFTTQDTMIPGDGDRSQGLNRYMYTEGNPVRWTDPTGHFIVESFIASLGIMAICGGESSCSTSPYWYKYAGLSRKCPDFTCEPVTAVDRLAQRHDSVDARLFSDAFDNFGENVDIQLKNIEADGTFIAQFGVNSVSGALFMENLNRAQKQLEEANWGKVGSWFGAIFLGAFYTVTDTTVGLTGSVLFLANIVVNAVAILITGVVQFFKGLFGDEESCDTKCLLQMRTAISKGPSVNLQP